MKIFYDLYSFYFRLFCFEYFPGATVQNYEPLIDHLDLEDPDDHHVLAAAIRSYSNVI